MKIECDQVFVNTFFTEKWNNFNDWIVLWRDGVPETKMGKIERADSDSGDKSKMKMNDDNIVRNWIVRGESRMKCRVRRKYEVSNYIKNCVFIIQNNISNKRQDILSMCGQRNILSYISKG